MSSDLIRTEESSVKSEEWSDANATATESLNLEYFTPDDSLVNHDQHNHGQPDEHDQLDHHGHLNHSNHSSSLKGKANLNGGDIIKSDIDNSSEDYETSDTTGEEPHPCDQLFDASSDLISLGEELPDTVTVLEGPYGSKVYLVGTAHFSEKSQQDVSQTIRKVQPNVVVLELCESRLSILSFDEKSIMEESKTMGIAKMRRNIQEYGMVQGIMYILLLSLSAHLTKELGMAPGGEFRRAFNEAKRVPGCVVHLGDRPVHITLRRAISSLSVWQKIRLAFGIIFNNETISKEEVEKCKQRDLLEEMLAEMTGEFPALSKVFVNERDVYLAYSLWLASSPIPDLSYPNGFRPSVVVGVVGIGHVPGIVKHWGQVSDKDIPPLMKIPETSMTTKIIKKSVKYTVMGLAVWGCYKLLVPVSLKNVLSEASLQTFSWIQTKIQN